MALFSANAVVDTDSDESLYATQYVRIVTQTKLTIKASNVAKAMTPGVGNIVQTVTNNNIYVIKYPDGARALFA